MHSEPRGTYARILSIRAHPADSLLRRDLRKVYFEYSAYEVVTVALVTSLYIYHYQFYLQKAAAAKWDINYLSFGTTLQNRISFYMMTAPESTTMDAGTRQLLLVLCRSDEGD
jgi:hypothetical protein